MTFSVNSSSGSFVNQFDAGGVLVGIVESMRIRIVVLVNEGKL